MSVFFSLETGSFCLASIHFRLTKLQVLLGGFSLGWCFAFSFSFCWRPIGNVVVELSFCRLRLISIVLVSSFVFVGSGLVHSSLIPFSELNYLVPSIGFSDLGVHILA